MIGAETHLLHREWLKTGEKLALNSSLEPGLQNVPPAYTQKNMLESDGKYKINVPTVKTNGGSGHDEIWFTDIQSSK